MRKTLARIAVPVLVAAGTFLGSAGVAEVHAGAATVGASVAPRDSLLVAAPGVVTWNSIKKHSFGFRTAGFQYTAVYSRRTKWTHGSKLKLHAGAHIKVTGSVSGKTIKVSRVIF